MTMIVKRTVCQELQLGNIRFTKQSRFRCAGRGRPGGPRPECPGSSALAKPLVLYYSLRMRSIVFVAAFAALVAAGDLAGCKQKAAPAQAPAAEERVYVSDEDGGNVIVINTANDAVVARIPVGK